jgi:hypothetical protein
MNAQLGQLLGALKGMGGKAMEMAGPTLGGLGGKIGQTGLNLSKEMLKNPMLTGAGAVGAGGMGIAALLRMLQGQSEQMPEMSEEDLMKLLMGRGAISTKAPGMSPTEGFAEQFKKY